MISTGVILALIGAGMSMILAGIGSAIGVGLVGQAGSGVVTEDPDKFGKILVLEIIPGTQGVYGFLISFLILNAIGVFSGIKDVSVAQGWAFFLASIPIAVVGLVSAIYQAKVAAAGVNILAKRPDELVKAMIFAVMVETYAVLALLISFLMLQGIKLG
jgi:V/A-type H+-transporting ATPase subunit K